MLFLLTGDPAHLAAHAARRAAGRRASPATLGRARAHEMGVATVEPLAQSGAGALAGRRSRHFAGGRHGSGRCSARSAIWRWMR